MLMGDDRKGKSTAKLGGGSENAMELCRNRGASNLGVVFNDLRPAG